MSASAAPQQAAFRFYNDDGSESASTAAAAQNTNVSVTDGGGNVSFQLRIGIQNTSANTTSYTWQLQYSKNGGAYTNVTTTSSNVLAFDSSHLTDNGSTTQRLTGLTGTFSGSNGVSEDGLGNSSALPSSGNKEQLYTVRTVDADLAGGDTIDFRVLGNGAVLSAGYTVTPRITNTSAATPFSRGFIF